MLGKATPSQKNKGFQRFGKYVGNGDANGNGAFIFTGFKPALVIIKVIR